MQNNPLYDRPNVIWVFGDQHRGDALGFRGDPNLNTPNIDRLAAEGASFNAVAGCPLCCPYRGSLLTSRYPHEAVPGHQRQLPPDMPTIAHAFRDADYHTAYIGKWHLDGYKEGEGRTAMHIVPPERRGGFDQWVGYENNNSQFDSWVHGGEGADAFHERLQGYETDELTDLFIDYLRDRGAEQAQGQGKPFFASLSVQPPHDPYVAAEEWMANHTPGGIDLKDNVPDIDSVRSHARVTLAGYYAMIENLDWNLGRIRSALDEAGLTWNTHIIFFSDHGDMHGSHGEIRKTRPWEESLRVPFIIGGGAPFYGVGGGWHEVPVNHVDVAPTTLGLCGIDAPDWMRGTDYSGYRRLDRAKPDGPDSAFLQYVEPVGYDDCINRAWRGIVTRDGWKYACFEGQPWMLFNLNEDPDEMVNLAYQNSANEKRRELEARLQKWIDDTGDSFALPST
jgi:arylsulfatase A-like enzyme